MRKKWVARIWGKRNACVVCIKKSKHYRKIPKANLLINLQSNSQHTASYIKTLDINDRNEKNADGKDTCCQSGGRVVINSMEQSPS
jgi:hypothetical protein